MGASARNLDFTNVRDGGQFNQSRIPAGDYLAIITKVEDAVTKKDKKPAWVFSLKIKNRPSSVFQYYCLLEENQVWKVRNLAIAAGKTVPKKRIKLDPNQLVGKLIGVTVDDAEDYQDKERSEISGVFPAAELGDDAGLSSDDASIDDEDEDEGDDDDIAGPTFTPDDDEDEADDEADDEDEAEEEAEDLSTLDRNELKARIKALQPDFQARKSQSDADLVTVLTNLLSADTSDDDEADDEEPAPAPAKSTAAARRKAAKQKVADDDIDELNIDDL